ncbi:MAG: type II secretion system protein [bacterium]|nr:type II secretion system protein [bacterium]
MAEVQDHIMNESPENRKPETPEKRKRAGYTMVEIMLAVGMIAIIATMAIPNLQHARQNGLETAAIQGLKELSEAEEIYYDTYGFYTDGHDQVQDLRRVDAIDSKAYHRLSLRRGVFIKGYSVQFLNLGEFPENYSIIAWPLERGMDLKTFMVISDGLVRDYGEDHEAPVTIY